MMRYSLNYRLTGFAVAVVLSFFSGCGEFPWKSMDIEPPYFHDSLEGGSDHAENGWGTFTEEGWQPNEDGSLTYNMPGMTQGVVEFDVTGLDRSVPATTLVTLIETPPADYIDPYMSHNPYKVQVTLNNFQESPRAPFSFLWTAKTFDPGVTEDVRYSDELPGDSYQETVDSRQAPVFLGETYTIRIEWFNGVAELSLNGEVIARHEYRPVLYNPSSLQVILGKTPEAKEFNLPDLTYSNVTITFPRYQD